MSLSTLIRRRAGRFARLVDEADGGRRSHVRSDLDVELAPLVDVVRRVSAVPLTVAPDPEFRVGLRAMLMARIERDGIGATAVAPIEPAASHTGAPVSARAGNRRVRARAAVLAGLTAGAVALSGVSAASDDAMPGDALYGVKRSTERAQLALASSDVNKGQLYLDFAKTRLDEARRVDPQRLHGSLVDMVADSREGLRSLALAAIAHRDPAPLGVVTTFVNDRRDELGNLLMSTPPQYSKDVLEALDELGLVSARAADLSDNLTCGSVTMDELGPIARHC